MRETPDINNPLIEAIGIRFDRYTGEPYMQWRQHYTYFYPFDHDSGIRLWKIGTTIQNPEHRIKQQRHDCGVYWIHEDEAFWTTQVSEQEMHETFAEQRVGAHEWFDLTPEQVDGIRKLETGRMLCPGYL